MDVVRVIIPGSSRPATVDANGHTLEAGDHCLVESGEGARLARVLVPTWDNPGWDGHAGQLPRVLRRATRRDEENAAYASRRDESALEDARRRISEHGLAMHLTAVHHAPDRARITFYFTASGRVDFRGLVRELATRHRTRIEMRQVGARDDARVKGGVGHCGRSLCCSTWLPDFSPVSIRMAKSQGMSLSPSKISGQCGRLMCCLRYELDAEGRPRVGGGCGPGGCGARRRRAGGPASDGP